MIFICILCLCMKLVYQVMVPKFFFDDAWPTTSTYIGFYQMEENTVDVLFFGSSHAASSFIPQELYNHYGITSYNLGCEQQNLVTSYFWLKEALRYQQPKAVVLDCCILFPCIKDEALNSPESCTRKAFDYMKWSPVKREAVRTICELDGKQSLLSYYFPNIRYHTRWKGLTENDFAFADMGRHYELKGYAPLSSYSGIEDFQPFEAGTSDDEMEMVPLMEEYLDNIVRLCEQENIFLILAKTPSVSENIAKYNTMQKYAEGHGVLFLDYNEKDLYEKISFDFLVNNDDSGHANLWGAQKITNDIGRVLTDYYGMEGRTDEQWENTRSYYENIQKDCCLSYVADIDTYLTALQDDRYDIFISAKDECTARLKDTTVQKLRELGLQADLQGEIGCSYIAVISEEGIREQTGYEELHDCGSVRDGRVMYDIAGAGGDCGNLSSIKIENAERSRNGRGLNIVVYNHDTMKIVDSVCFDTHEEENAAVR